MRDTRLQPQLATRWVVAVFLLGVPFQGSVLAQSRVVAWGANWDGQTNVPAGLTNVAAIAAGNSHNLALRTDGTVLAWGANWGGQTDVPAGLTDVVAIAAGEAHSLALCADGTVLAWGANWGGQTDVPAGLTDVVAIAAGEAHSLALRTDGTVVAWGGQSYVHPITVPAGLTNVVAIVAGSSNSLALRADGTVVEWGTSDTGPSHLPAGVANVDHLAAGYNFDMVLRADGTVFVWGNNDFGQTNVPSGLTGVMGLAGGIAHCLVLQSNGTVVAWGNNWDGQTNVPSDLTDGVAIAAGGNHSLVLRADGTVAAWGANESGQANVPGGLTNVTAIAAGFLHNLVLTGNSTTGPPFVARPLVDREAVCGGPVSFRVSVSGQPPLSYQWRFEGTDLDGATNTVLLLTNVQPAQAGLYAVVVSNALGAVTNGPARLTVLPLRITAQPQSLVVRPGQTATFSLEVQSTVPCEFQWRRNGTNLPGATNAALTLSDLQLEDDGGVYSVLVSNLHGVVVSAEAVLSVRVGPVVVGWGQYHNGFSDVPVTVPADLTEAVAIATGNDHNLALWPNGTVVGWGNNDYGQTSVPAGLTGVVALAAGGANSLALRADGTVVAWGANNAGQTNVPASLANVVAIAAGVWHSLALRADGTVVAWGSPYEAGQTNVPVGLTNVVAIAAGIHHSLALRADGTIVAWGSAWGPSQTNVPADLTNVVAIAAGPGQNLALRADGTVVGFGENWNGQTNVPAGLMNAVAVAAGGNHSLALRADGTVVAWGANWSGQSDVPASLANVVAIAAGGGQSLALLGNGTPFLPAPLVDRQVARGGTVYFHAAAAGQWPLSYQWQFNGVDLPGATDNVLVLTNVQPEQAGLYSVVVSNRFGSASLGHAQLTVLPLLITGQPQSHICFSGGTVTLAVEVRATVPSSFQWRFQGTDLPGATNATLTLRNARLDQSGAYSVVVSNAFGLVTSAEAVLSVGLVSAWGNNEYGQTNVPAGLTNIMALAGGSEWCLALQIDGALVAWGRNEFGQTSVPANLSNAVAIAAGGSHGLVLRADGTVVAWGNSQYGQTDVPIGLVNILAIAAGYLHSLALRADGKVVAWGHNWGGQTNVPVDLTNVVAIAAGANHSLALRADGTVVAWGYNQYGQTSVPAGLTGVVAIAAGSDQSLALRADGTVVAWGYNGDGALSVPTGLANVAVIAAGGMHNLALRADGTVVAWGINYWGQTNVPAGLANVVAVAAGGGHSLALIGSGLPFFTTPLFDQQVLGGGTLTLNVTALGENPLSYQWLFNGTNLPGATSNVLTLTEVQPAEAGCYSVVVSNALGVVTNGPAWLTVLPLLITAQPLNQVKPAGRVATFTVVVQANVPCSFQWQFNGVDLPGATNSMLTLMEVMTNQAGVYSVIVSNALGSVTSSNALLTVLPIPSSEVFQIVELSAEGAFALEHNQVTGDDRGGIAASSTRVFYSGDGSTGAFDLEDLSGGQSLGRRYDSVVSDLKTETVYLLGNGDTPLAYGGGTLTSLLELDGETGLPTGQRTDLSEPVPLNSGSGLFAGFGCVVVHNGSRVYTIFVPSGVVVDEGAMSMPNHAGTENWAFWGVAEYFNGATHLVYVRDSQTIVRSRVPDGLTVSVASFANLSDMGCFTVSLRMNRWYFHHEGTSQFRSGDETIGYAEAAFYYVQEPRAPEIYHQPSDQTVMAGRNARFSVGASGSPLFYQWQFNGFDIHGATNLSLKLTGVTTNEAGAYSVIVSNALGSVTSAVAALIVNLPGTRYVWQGSPNPRPPFTNWATAAHTLQEAVDLAWDGDIVLVTNGVYATGGRAIYGLMTNRVAIDKPVRVESVNGPEVTIIQGYQVPETTNGDGAIRCVYLTNGAILSGFTLTRGATSYGNGGGVWSESTNAVVSNCVVVANSASSGGGGAYGGALYNCTLTGNSAGWGGGARGDWERACILYNCTLTGNSASDGGGVWGDGESGCILYNCTLTGNSARWGGGGACGITLYNCTLTANSAAYGGGAGGGNGNIFYWPCTLYNCSLTGNSASSEGGGAWLGILYNCTLTDNSASINGGALAYSSAYNSIVYDNTAPDGVNYSDWCYFTNSCTIPLPPGEGNIDLDPQLDDTLHLMSTSPCIGAGSSAYSQGVDMDGEPWGDPPSMGADEYGPSGTSGALTVALKPAYAWTGAGVPVRYTAQIRGALTATVWDFGDGTVVSNQPSLSHAWTAPGTYTVRLTAYNENRPEGVTATGLAQVVEFIHYVNQANTTPVSPYTNWQTAATTIQDAVDAAAAGGWVVVTNGVYGVGTEVFQQSCVFLGKPITVRSVNGPAVTVIQGTDTARCAYVGDEAVLSGFTLTNGHAGYGGGAWLEPSGVVTNCVLTGNRAGDVGGGAYGGSLCNSKLIGNSTAGDGGGALGSTLYNCLLTGNVASMAGGAVTYGNLYSCTVVGNSADCGGGVVWSFLHNSVVWDNTAVADANHAACAVAFSCTTPLPEGIGNIEAEPGFVSPATGKFHLRADSPCIDAGMDLSAFLCSDLAGLPRPVDGNGDGAAGFDLGAYEYSGKPADANSDGIPDGWCRRYGLDPLDGTFAGTDPDHDGQTTFQEWVADTDPNDPNSHLRIIAIASGPPVSVSLQSSAARFYTLQSCADLSTGLWTPVSGQTDIPGTGGLLSLTDPNPSPSRFYRVSVRMP